MVRASENCVSAGHIRSGGYESHCFTCAALERVPNRQENEAIADAMARIPLNVGIDLARPGSTDYTAYACAIKPGIKHEDRLAHVIHFIKCGLGMSFEPWQEEALSKIMRSKHPRIPA